MPTPRLLVLGPQSHKPTLPHVIQELGIKGDLALITAGWQEREEEDHSVREALPKAHIHNLRIHSRCESIFTEDPEIFHAHRERQDRARHLQEIYRQRLSHALEASRRVLQMQGPTDLLEPERLDSIEALRRLDEHHLARVHEIHHTFEERWKPLHRASIAHQREEILATIQRCQAILIAGGHVAVLLNRLRLFDLTEAFRSRDLIAWSAGSMALCDKVVLFHDHPPQGRGDPEILDRGLGVIQGLLPFPHARRRLLLTDRLRVSLLASRFRPSLCAALDEGGRVDLQASSRWEARWTTRLLCEDGTLLSSDDPSPVPLVLDTPLPSSPPSGSEDLFPHP